VISVRSQYLHDPLSGQARVVDNTVQALRAFGEDRFDAIAFRGISGAIIAPVVAYLMGKKLIAVRKEAGSHSDYMVEGPTSAMRYVIVDDCRSSGKTADKIIEDIDQHLASEHRCIGMYLYNGNDDNPDHGVPRIR
jgi:adenine/guanine phosphoribosyltransferase-like PRPP-binding protein